MGLFIWRGLSNAPTSPKYLVLSGLGRVQSRLVGSDSRQVVKIFPSTIKQFETFTTVTDHTRASDRCHCAVGQDYPLPPSQSCGQEAKAQKRYRNVRLTLRIHRGRKSSRVNHPGSVKLSHLASSRTGVGRVQGLGFFPCYNVCIPAVWHTECYANADFETRLESIGSGWFLEVTSKCVEGAAWL